MMEYEISLAVDDRYVSYHRARYWFQEGWLFIRFYDIKTKTTQTHVFPNSPDHIHNWTMVESER